MEKDQNERTERSSQNLSENILLASGHQTSFDGKTILFSIPRKERSETIEDDALESETSEPIRASNDSASFDAEEKNDESNVSLDFEFFAKHFARNKDSEEKNDKAFEAGLHSVFQLSEDVETSTEDDLSESEIFQKEEEEARRENIDATIRQNDADSLYQLGEKYEQFDDEPILDSKKTNVDPASILEAMLFVGDRENRPLSLTRATELMRNVSELEAIEALHDLNERYYKNDAPYYIIRDRDGFRLVLRPQLNSIQERFGGKIREFKLSQRAIDVLAIIAYRQPISLAEIQEIRSNCGGVLTLLVKRDLIAQEKKTVDGKKILYFQTTDRFLKLFNINSLDDLPIVEEIDFR